MKRDDLPRERREAIVHRLSVGSFAAHEGLKYILVTVRYPRVKAFLDGATIAQIEHVEGLLGL